ncbi:hypothetical protein SAY87_030166 [Trapa incisa]|uniref:Uncharacterized protein n=1 Tax=Trapa incisa TaxID=236973 RepID=A0AAN7K9H5_9MYRT|nr:hypothetical protein SAY87_030166 [Trapa incisa]
MDALQSHSLQAELRDRTEQYNHLWLGFQTQFMEMERFHLHTIQQLQLELAEVRDRCGTHAGESHVSQVKSNEISCFGHHNGAQRDTNGSSRKSGTLSYGNSDNSLVASNGIMGEHVAGLRLTSSSVLPLPAYATPGQMTAFLPFVTHQQGTAQLLRTSVPQSHADHYQTLQPTSTRKECQNAQGVSENQLLQTQGC